MTHVDNMFYYQLFLLNPCFASEFTYLTNTFPIQHLPGYKAWFEAQARRTSAFIYAPKICYASWQHTLLHNRIRSQGIRGGCQRQEAARTCKLYLEATHFDIDLHVSQRSQKKAVDEEVLELPLEQFGRPKAPAGTWGSCIRIVDPIEVSNLIFYCHIQVNMCSDVLEQDTSSRSPGQ